MTDMSMSDNSSSSSLIIQWLSPSAQRKTCSLACSGTVCCALIHQRETDDLIGITGELQLLAKEHKTQQWLLQRVMKTHPLCDGDTASVHFDREGQRLATSKFRSNHDSVWKVWDVATGLIIPLIAHTTSCVHHRRAHPCLQSDQSMLFVQCHLLTH